MPHDPNVRHRRSVRLPGHDYSSAGAYFLTICTHQREAPLGEIVNDEMVLSDSGRIVAQEWERTGALRSCATLDEFVVMPNHVHGIIMITDGGSSSVGAQRAAPLPPDAIPRNDVQPRSLGAIVRGFKSAVTKRINALRGTPFWQRGYYEHIIRNDRELRAIRQYIADNLLKWALDSENPAHAIGI